jgi:invasion protein IalB
MRDRIGVSVAVLLILTSAAIAQRKQPPPEKFSTRPVQPSEKAPAIQPQQPAPAGADQAAARPADQPEIVYSPWTKFCGKDNKPAAKEICLTVKEARLKTGRFVAGAALIEQAGEEKKLFRVTLPLGMQLAEGARILLDQEQPMQGRYTVCLPNGCMADFDVTPDLLGKLKGGQQIVLHGINLPGQAASYMLPLADFAKANEGPPTDPQRFEEDQKKLRAAPR